MEFAIGTLLNAFRNLFITFTATIISIILITALAAYFGHGLFSGVWFLMMAGYLIGDFDNGICRRLTNNYGESSNS